MVGKMFVILSLFCALVVAASKAEEPDIGHPKKLQPPKHVTLNEAQQKQLDEANEDLERGYKELMATHDPERAVLELRKAYAIMNQLGILARKNQMAGVADVTGETSAAGTASGALEKVVEISGVNAGATLADDNLPKRKTIQAAEDKAKKVEAEQATVTFDLQQMAAAGNEQPAAKKDDAPKQVLHSENTLDPQQNQPPPADGKKSNAADASKPQQQQDQKGQPPTGDAGEQQAQNDPKAGEAGKPAPSAKNDGHAEALADKEAEIAKTLNEMASQFAAMGKAAETSKTADKFRQAAAAAENAGEKIKSGDMASAAAASAEAQRKISDAVQTSNSASSAALNSALAALKKEAAKLQENQQKILGQAPKVSQENGAPLPDEVKQQRQTALAIEQAKLKPGIESLQKEIQGLAESAGGNETGKRTGEQAAKEELEKAAANMQKGKVKQSAVDAAIKLGEGDTEGATVAMAKIQSALNDAQHRLDAAAEALAGNDDARAERDYKKLQNLAAELRRIENTATTAAGMTPSSDKGSAEPKNKSSDGKSQPGKDPGNLKEQAAGTNPVPSVPAEPLLSASWNQVLSKSAKETATDALTALPDLAKSDQNAANKLKEMSSKDLALDRNFEQGLNEIRGLRSAIEKLALDASKKIAKQAENKAMKNYRKDDIPANYKTAVAAYYEELAKEQNK